MGIGNTPRIVIIVIGLLLLTAAVVLLIIKNNENSEQTEILGSQPSTPATVTGYDSPDESSGRQTENTENEAVKTQQEQAQLDTEMQILYKAALAQILTSGEWRNSSRDIALTFSDTECRAVKTTDGVENVSVYQYVVTSLSVTDDVYYIEWTVTDSSGIKSSASDVTVTVSGNSYTLFSSSLPYDNTFTKTAFIVFTQPSLNPQNSLTDQDGANSGGAQPDETITNIVVRESEYVMDSKTQKEIEDHINQEVIGVWRGTFEEMRNANTVYWVYTFTPNGDYTFTNNEIDESGIFTITHDFDKVVYGSTFHLVPVDGDERMVNFHLSESDQQVKMSLEGGTDPTYVKMH